MMKRRLIMLVGITIILAGLCLSAFAKDKPTKKQKEEPSATQRKVLVITVDGIINPVSAEFITREIKKANDKNYEALVIELDTPGGLMESMRDIIKSMVGSGVPVVVYVAPRGARAASAGVFITMASHIAAMAPETNIGAAHPVTGQGQDMGKTMSEKVTNDAVAYIRSLATEHGRNADWAEQAVRKSISSSEQEALKKHVVDLVSPNLKDLLATIDGRTVKTAFGEKTLHTKDAAIDREEMGLRHKILDLISNPNIAYILMLLGFYGLFFEMTNPGSIFPGVIGGICLILAFFAFQSLPVNYAGLLLIILAVILFILEIKVHSYGALTIGGIISMTLGSIMLFESSGPFVRLSLTVIVTAVGVTVAFFLVVVRLAVKAHMRRPTTGTEGLIDEEGVARTDITPQGGQVLFHGELWSAYSDEPIAKGERVVVKEVVSLKVKVSKITPREG